MIARIRPIENSNIADLIALGDAAGLSPWTAQNYLDEIKNPDSVMLRLENATNEIIGFVVGRLVIAADSEEAIDAEIYNIAVTASMQKQGNGQALLDAFVVRGRKAGVRKIWLEVRESNLRAIRFYEKNGFRVVQTRKAFYSNPSEPGLLMVAEINSTTA